MVWPVIAAVAGGLIAKSSSKKTNRHNADQSEKARKWNAKEDRLAEERAEKATIRAEKRAVTMLEASEKRAEKSAVRAEERAHKRQLDAEKRAFDRLDPALHRKRMEDAGFNPLAAGMGSVTDIGAVSSVGANASFGAAVPAASGVVSHNTPAGFVASQDNGPAMGRIVAQAITGVGEQILQADQLAIQRQELDMERTRLNLLAKQMAMTPKIPGVYGDQSATQYRTAGNDYGGNTAGNSAVAGPAGGPQPIQAVELSAQEVKFPDGNSWIKSNPTAAEDAEMSYGEIGAELQGLGTLGDDVYGNLTGSAFHPKWGWEFNWPRPKYRPKSVERKAKTGWTHTRPLPPKKPAPYSGMKSSSSAAQNWLERLN